MARLPRYALHGQTQHVIQRGNNRGSIFNSEHDYLFYRECLRLASTKHQCAIHAYVLMPNHVHLLLTPRIAGAVSKTMQFVGQRYVRHFNNTYRRTGTLWEGRYRATLIDTEQYLLTCCRYIELNPVRAGIVSLPGQYPWSSFHANALGQLDPIVECHSQYKALGVTPKARQSSYRKFLRARVDDSTLNLIRDVTNKAWVLGGNRFREQLEPIANRRTAPLPRGGVRQRNPTANQETSHLSPVQPISKK